MDVEATSCSNVVILNPGGEVRSNLLILRRVLEFVINGVMTDQNNDSESQLQTDQMLDGFSMFVFFLRPVH